MVTSPNGRDSAAAALGLSSPLLVPWPVLAGLPPGPQLSKQDALVAHDTLAGNPAAAEIITGGN